MIAWSLLALVTVSTNLEPDRWIVLALGVIGVYFFGFGLMRWREQ